MSDERAERIADFVGPLRVKPGSKVRLERDFDPRYKAGLKKREGIELLRTGIAVAVALSVLNVFRRAWWPYNTVLGRVQDLEGYHDVRSYPQARQLPGLVIYRFDAPLIFANAKTFRDEIRRWPTRTRGRAGSWSRRSP
jgi:hypothetical protein